MADKLPDGPKATPRRRSMFGEDVTAAAQAASGTEQSSAPTPAKKATAKKPAKGWDRSGQVSVVLGDERHERLNLVWRKRGIQYYETRADLIRAAIDEKLDRLDP